MIFFWTVFDGILSYLVPILITQRGYTNTQMGLIFSFSSFAGMIFDFILSNVLRLTNYLKTFLLILIISFIFPIVLWSASNLAVYLLAMAIWGLYYDLYTFASYDFVSRNSDENLSHSNSFGIIELFRSMAGLAAPLIASYFIVGRLGLFNIYFPLIFLAIGMIFYILVYYFSPLSHRIDNSCYAPKRKLITQIKQWKGIGKILLPVLFFNVTLFIFDATFWTIGPLFTDSFTNFPYFSGVFMTLYNLPSLFTVWKISAITNHFGKKRTALVAFMLANAFLIPIGYSSSPIFILFLVFCSAIFVSITWPAIEGAIADYVSETNTYRPIIEAMSDLTTNIGYIIGPIFAGILSDKIGINLSFTTLGIVNVIIIVVLLLVTPKHIRVHISQTD